MAVTMGGSSEDLMRAVFQKVRLVDVKFQSEPDFNRPQSLPRIKSLPSQRPVSQPAEEIFHTNGVNSPASGESHEPAEFNCVLVGSQEDGDEPQSEANEFSPEANLPQSDEDEPQNEADGLPIGANLPYSEGDEAGVEAREPPMSYEHVYDYRNTSSYQVDDGSKPQPTTSQPFKSAERDHLMAELKLRHASLKGRVDSDESEEHEEEGEKVEDVEDPILEAVFQAVQLRHPILMCPELESIEATVDLSDEESPRESHDPDASPMLSPASDNLHLEITFSPASNASHPTFELPSVQIDSARKGHHDGGADETVLSAKEEAIYSPGMAEDRPTRVETASTRIESSQLERISYPEDVGDASVMTKAAPDSRESTHQSVISPVNEVVIRAVEAGGLSSSAKLALGSLEPSRQDQIRTELGIGSTSPGGGIKDLVERFSQVPLNSPTSKPPPMNKRQSVTRFALPPLDLSHGREQEDGEEGSGHRRYVKTPHPTSRQSSAAHLLGGGSRVIGAGGALNERDYKGDDHFHEHTIPAAPPSSVWEEMGENPNTIVALPTKAIDEDKDGDEERQRSVQELREKFSFLLAGGNGKAQPATTTMTTTMVMKEDGAKEANADSTPSILTSSAHIGSTNSPTSVSFTAVRLRSTGRSLTMADSSIESSPPPPEQVLPGTRMEKSKSAEGTFPNAGLENAVSAKVSKSGGLSVRTSAEVAKPPAPKPTYYNFYSGSEVAAKWKKKANSDSNSSTNSVDGSTPVAQVEKEPPIGSLAAIRRSLSSVPNSPSVGSNGSINTGQPGKKSWATTVGAYPPPSPGSSPSSSPTPFNNSMEKPLVVRNFNVPSSPSAVRNFYKVWGSKKSTSPPPSGQNGGK